MIASLFFAAMVAISAPSPLQYYSQALATMQQLPEPAYVSLETTATARGIGISQPCQKGEIEWNLSFGRRFLHELTWHALYNSESDDETIQDSDGKRCHGPSVLDRPTWSDTYAWIRYGVLTPAPKPPTQAHAMTGGSLKTIADVSVIAPGAYRATDGGARRCPFGSAGHELHFSARFQPDKHPLRDAIIETHSMRICMIRFDLGTYQAAGTGFRGDMTLDFGNVGGYWLVTSGHAAMALRAAGISLKSVVIDFSYGDVTFPATAPDGLRKNAMRPALVSN